SLFRNNGSCTCRWEQPGARPGPWWGTGRAGGGIADPLAALVVRPAKNYIRLYTQPWRRYYKLPLLGASGNGAGDPPPYRDCGGRS
ncbi:MAG: hypothetical protein WC343_15475, partial [Bacilli bacterium]